MSRCYLTLWYDLDGLQYRISIDRARGLLYFYREPESVTVKEGDEVGLHCVLEQEPPGTRYSWYKYSSDTTHFKDSLLQVYSKSSSSNLLADANLTVLSFASISRGDEGYYQCKVQTNIYTIYSGVAFVKVHYYDELEELATEQEKTVDSYEAEIYFSCGTFNTSYNLYIFWKKDGASISNLRMFVYPEDYMSSQGITTTRGSLLIINALPEDSGRYECHTRIEGAEFSEEKIRTVYQLAVNEKLGEPTEKNVNPVFASFPNGVQGPQSVTVESGGAVTLVCAAKGYPAPSYRWKHILSGSSVDIKSSTELHILSDYNRELVVNMIEEGRNYACFMSNTVNGDKQDRETRFYISVKEGTESSDSDIEFVQESNSSAIVLRPNQYKPFEVSCRVKKSSSYQHQIVWLKNGKKTDWITKHRITKLEQLDPEIQGDTFYFHNPNESDLGVYQCVVVSTQAGEVRVKQRTSYVTLSRDHLAVHSESRLPNYQFLAGPYYVDEAEEACRSKKMHLVSILDSKENDFVLEMIRENNVTNVWIGLTREVPEPEGTWKWTMPGDNSFFFSNWDNEKPDNQYGHQEYSVMLNESGKWLDVKRRTGKRAAICKNYTLSCTSVDNFYEGRVGVRGWEELGASYYVGQQVDVYCRYPKNETFRNAQVITCGLDANFDEPLMEDCLDHDTFFQTVYRSASSNLSCSCLLTTLLCFMGAHSDLFIRQWADSLQQQKKMLFYLQIKELCSEEPYLGMENRNYRSHIAKIRSSSHDPMIERGKYANASFRTPQKHVDIAVTHGMAPWKCSNAYLFMSNQSLNQKNMC
ncbi:hypothetical protein ACHWQZ_G008917 [Mnemiopsis leidyi]